MSPCAVTTTVLEERKRTNRRRNLERCSIHWYAPAHGGGRRTRVLPPYPVLQGGKKYENLDWYTDLDPEGPIRKNAELNEKGIRTQKTSLGTQNHVGSGYLFLCM